MKRIVLIFLAISIFLVGCGANNSEASKECIEKTNEFLTYFKNKDFESMYNMSLYKDQYLAGTYNKDSVIGRMLFDSMTQGLSYEIKDTVENGDNVYVKFHIVTKDYNDVLSRVVGYYTDFLKKAGDTMTSEEIDDVLETILDEQLKSAKVYEKDTQLDFIKKDGKWIIEENVGVYDDITGGYLSYCFNMNSVIR